jgi:uncharacterized protein Yka (UPF0111/DUF47 family)
MSKVNLLAYLLPPEDKIFYSLFEHSAQVCKDAASLFDEVMTDGLNEEHIIRAKQYKHRSNELIKETLKTLNNTFVTPIDREDIQHIAILLNKITKKIVKACINLRVYRFDCYTENMVAQAKTLVKASEELGYIIHKFKKVSSVKDITESNLRMKDIETHGDEYSSMLWMHCFLENMMLLML